MSRYTRASHPRKLSLYTVNTTTRAFSLRPTGTVCRTSPLLWGTEDYVKNLFRHRVQGLEMTRHEYCETAMNSRAYFELFRDSFGPMVAIHAGLRDQAARIAELDAAFMKFIARWNRGASEGRVQIPYEYLLVVAHKFGR